MFQRTPKCLAKIFCAILAWSQKLYYVGFCIVMSQQIQKGRFCQTKMFSLTCIVQTKLTHFYHKTVLASSTRAPESKLPLFAVKWNIVINTFVDSIKKNEKKNLLFFICFEISNTIYIFIWINFVYNIKKATWPKGKFLWTPVQLHRHVQV